jgi:SAM-dependent methyltransferase
MAFPGQNAPCATESSPFTLTDLARGELVENLYGMGLDVNTLLFAVDAKKSGINLGDTITIGRLHVNVYPKKIAQVFKRNDIPYEKILRNPPEFSEPCFEALGASSVSSLDASNYEGATFVHDLNQPLPENLKGRFDTVFDGGTLEHVFNFPVAIRNCMEMLRIGGRFYIHTCANNACGHGFYQLSPELFYRVFSPENGFEVERMVVHMVGPYNRWYEVEDPNRVRARVELITSVPVNLLVRARKKAAVPIFQQMPQQSDYVVLWEESAKQKSGEARPGRLKPWLRNLFPGLARLLRAIGTGLEFYRRQSLRNRKYFHPVKKP